MFFQGNFACFKECDLFLVQAVGTHKHENLESTEAVQSNKVESQMT